VVKVALYQLTFYTVIPKRRASSFMKISNVWCSQFRLPRFTVSTYGLATSEGLNLGGRRLSQAAVLMNGINNVSSYSRVRDSQFRLPPAAPLHCPIVVPLAPSVLPLAPSLLPPTPSVLPLAPSLLPLKRLCSLS